MPRIYPIIILLLLLMLPLSCGEPRQPFSQDTAELLVAVTPEGVLAHERRFQEIAAENGGSRAAGTPGYDASVRYVAQSLADAGYDVSVQRFEIPPSEESGRERQRTANVIADAKFGSEDRTVMVGAHLDSVEVGPGINDNGSGAATVLEVAIQTSRLGIETPDRLRFAFWGAEEIGLLGSRHYVESLTESEVEDLDAYLNFDMVGSPNYVRMVYGSGEPEEVLAEYFASRGLEFERISFRGRSDHAPFAEAGVPTGGLFSGASGRKSEEEAETYGGEAGEPYDECYHRSCDDLDNLDAEALDEMSDAAAHATLTLARDGR
jgi:aminopeptidase S